jgi:hypothetical protein
VKTKEKNDKPAFYVAQNSDKADIAPTPMVVEGWENRCSGSLL